MNGRDTGTEHEEAVTLDVLAILSRKWHPCVVDISHSGCDVVLRKPFVLDTTIEMVENQLRRRGEPVEHRERAAITGIAGESPRFTRRMNPSVVKITTFL